MSPDHNHRDDETTTTPAGDEATGDAPAVRPAGSDGPEDGAFDKPSVGAPAPRSVHPEPPPADTAQTAEIRPEGEPPLITAVEIENFKGIGRPVRIELRPITLLFGRNSAGKSTVLHALCYAHEILRHRNVDAHKTDLGGDQIDLGGFRRFVHGHDLKRSVRLRFELNLRDRELPELAGAMRIAPYPWEVGLGSIETGWIGLTVRWSELRRRPILSTYEVGVDGEIVGRIMASGGDAKPDLLANLWHPMLDRVIREGDLAALERKLEALRAERQALEAAASPSEVGEVRETSGPQSFGRTYHRMAVREAVSSGALPSFGHHLEMELKEGFDEGYHELWHCVSTLLVGIGGLLRDELAWFRYLGPLRELHPRTVVERDRSVPGRWADGSAAWDVLNRRAQVTLSRIANDFGNPRERNRAMVVRRVSDWLSREDRLDTGYELRVRNVVELPANTPLVDVLNKGVQGGELAAIKANKADAWGAECRGDVMRKAPRDKIDALADAIAQAQVHRQIELVGTTGEGLPVRTSEIGVGVSQVLPVVVAALDPDRPAITAIEQPELHVHPRLQVELGDLFAEQAAGGGVFLIETHSEHLMLRLLRRIEETGSNELPEGKPALKPDQVSVVYVEQIDGEVRATRLRIDESGEFIDRWPQGFFDERDDELF